ncbi:MAG: LysR family transcriptional regulator [Desulfomicrobium escambiense]|nr:LysR family transcriptional regulator [Desulfomicrobium escambiense]
MAHLNYNHVYYFWVVARKGSIARASEALFVTPQTISGQLRTLEEALGAKLFRKQGRGLALTDSGALLFQYADEMFRVGAEARERAQGRQSARRRDAAGRGRRRGTEADRLPPAGAGAGARRAAAARVPRGRARRSARRAWPCTTSTW